MKNHGLKIFFVALTLGLSACAHSVHQVHVSDFNPYSPIEAGDMVKGSSEQFSIMGFVTQTDYVDVAYRRLLAACPTGTITGVTTQFSTSLGFFSWTNKILMQGLCVKRAAATAARN